MVKKLSRRQFMVQIGGLTALSLLTPACKLNNSVKSEKPNIIIILADDLGYGDLGCYGCPDICAPAIAKLATEGVRFTSFYANAPECTPTRTALLTGRYQHRVGGLECAIGIGNVGRYDDAIRLRETHDLGLPVEETTIARMLKDVGYATAICGKWHLGYEPKFSPNGHDFDYFFGPIGGAVDYFYHCEYTGEPSLFLNDKLIQMDGYLTDLITDKAVNFINRQHKKPFFLYMPYTAPHTPYQGPEDRSAKYIPREDYGKGTRSTYVAMVERMDEGIARILETLKDKNISNNTVVIFASDNGANRKGRNFPFSGGKGRLFEGGIRVPCIIKWPGKIRGGTVSDQPAMTMDLTNSIVRIAGAKPPDQRTFDGIDIIKWIEINQPSQDRALFWRARRGQRTSKAVRDASLKYIYNKEGEDIQEYLFDLEKDPAEENNLFLTKKEDVRRLKAKLEKWEKEVKHER